MKPSDLNISEINDKASSKEAKKIIDVHPCWKKFSTGCTNKKLITDMSNDAVYAASVWWGEVPIYYCKGGMVDLFVQTPQFKDEGFEMICYI